MREPQAVAMIRCWALGPCPLDNVPAGGLFIFGHKTFVVACSGKAYEIGTGEESTLSKDTTVIQLSFTNDFKTC